MLQNWKGYMNYPLEQGWVCETCEGYNGLTWGIQDAHCRCNLCHMEYDMRDNSREERPIVARPISATKEEWKTPMKEAWRRWHIPNDEWTNTQWKEVWDQVDRLHIGK